MVIYLASVDLNFDGIKYYLIDACVMPVLDICEPSVKQTVTDFATVP